MNIKKIALSICALAIVSSLGTGCRKYLDTNTNPNVAQDAGPEFLLPSAQIALGSAMGVDMQVNGSIWAQHWTQAPSASQYKIYDQYSPTSSTYDRVWSLFYSSELEDLDQMEKKAAASNQVFYVAISKLLKAYTFQVITDAWGDVPFSEALKGQIQDGGIVSPHFDSQQSIYDGIISLDKEAMAILNALPPSSTIKGDLIYGTNSVVSQRDGWRRFGNTLLLKIYLRLAEKDPAKAQAGVTALYATNPSFIGDDGVGDDAQINYISTAGNQNPLYSEIVGLNKTQNLVGSSTVLDSMTEGNTDFPIDLRAVFLFEPATTGYVGLRQGLYTAPASTPISIPSAATGANAQDENSATAPVKFLTSYESKFLQAEASARGWGAAGQDASLFYDGIELSFKAYASRIPDVTLRDSFAGAPITAATTFNLDVNYAIYRYENGDTLTGFIEGDPVDNADASYWAQYPQGGTTAQKLRHIITQKWFSMTGNQGFEAWTEWRRTGYPDFFVISANSLIGNKFPHRFFYPDVELQRNSNFPGQKLITDRVYWDIH